MIKQQTTTISNNTKQNKYPQHSQKQETKKFEFSTTEKRQ